MSDKKLREFYVCEQGEDISPGVSSHWCSLDAPTNPNAKYFKVREVSLELDKVVAEMADALEQVCKRNDIEQAVLDYYGKCAMVLANYKKLTGG